MLMGHLQVSSNLHDPMGRARFPGEAQTGKLTCFFAYSVCFKLLPFVVNKDV